MTDAVFAVIFRERILYTCTQILCLDVSGFLEIDVSLADMSVYLKHIE